MPMKDADNPPTAAELAARESGEQVGNGLTCPKCGAAHLGNAYHSNELPGGTVHRYRQCRNPSCAARYLVRQPVSPPEEIVREIPPRVNDSNLGNQTLKLLRETA